MNKTRDELHEHPILHYVGKDAWGDFHECFFLETDTPERIEYVAYTEDDMLGTSDETIARAEELIDEFLRHGDITPDMAHAARARLAIYAHGKPQLSSEGGC